MKNNKFRLSFSYITKVLTFSAIINLPAALNNFDGWFYFYKLSSERKFGLGSIWEILDLTGSEYKPSNLIYLVCTIVLLISISIYVYRFETRSKLSQIAYYFIFAFVLFNKIYSPQYVIWLTFLAVLTIQTSRQKLFFIFWQITELIYHFAIWRYLYWQGYGLHASGLNSSGYMWASIARYIGLLVFTGSLIYPQLKSNLNNQNN